MGKRRWRARTPRPGGTSDAPPEREASWSAERQFRFGRQTGAFDQFAEFCLTPAGLGPSNPRLQTGRFAVIFRLALLWE